jgi:IclR helix-turn-helix domain
VTSRRAHGDRRLNAKPERWGAVIPPTAAGRGVLDGAFAILDALAHADEGLGLTALARASGLAKTSAHRLAEQLVTLGAVQCVALPQRRLHHPLTTAQGPNGRFCGQFGCTGTVDRRDTPKRAG